MAKLNTRKQEVTTRQMQARASFVPNTWNEEERTIEVDFASERPVRRFDWDNWELYDEILEISEKAIDFGPLNAGVSILKDHRHAVDSIVGITVKGWIEGKKGRALIQLDDDPANEQFRRKVAKGIIRQISVGYEVNEYVRTKKNEKDRAEIPKYTATRWMPREISFVAVPADETVGSRSADLKAVSEREMKLRNSTNLHTTTIIRQMEDENEDVVTDVVEDPTPQADPAARSKTKQQKKPARSKKQDPEEEEDNDSEERSFDEGIQAERARASSIRTIVADAGLGGNFAERFIKEGHNLDKVRQLVLEELSGKRSGNGVKGASPDVSVKRDQADQLRKVRSIAMAARAGYVDMDKLDNAIQVQADKYRSFSLMDMARTCLEDAGVNIRGWSPEQVAKAAIQGRGTSSTSDFPELLGGVIHQVLLSAYEEIDDVWRTFCRVGSVNDFRDHRMIRSWGLQDLPVVNETEEYKNIPLVDATGEIVRVFKRGGIVNLSWEMIVNDELDTFSNVIADLTRSYYRTIENTVFATLAMNSGNGPTMADGKALYHVDHKNLITAAAMSSAALDNMRVQMALQTDNAGQPISFRPNTLLVHTTLESTAKVYNDAQYDVDVSNKFQVPNKSRGLFKSIVSSPRVSPVTAYYAFADPRVEPVIQVSFLNGKVAPVIERQDEFRTDGFSYKIRGVFGVGAVGYRGTQLNKGA